MCPHNTLHTFLLCTSSFKELFGNGAKKHYLMFNEMPSDAHELQLHGDQCHVCFYYSVRNSYGLELFSLIEKFVFIGISESNKIARKHHDL